MSPELSSLKLKVTSVPIDNWSSAASFASLASKDHLTEIAVDVTFDDDEGRRSYGPEKYSASDCACPIWLFACLNPRHLTLNWLPRESPPLPLPPLKSLAILGNSLIRLGVLGHVLLATDNTLDSLTVQCSDALDDLPAVALPCLTSLHLSVELVVDDVLTCIQAPVRTFKLAATFLAEQTPISALRRILATFSETLLDVEVQPAYIATPEDLAKVQELGRQQGVQVFEGAWETFVHW
ncbi:hypothetical protein ACM66B_001576 [Microbotryomycetes sp. NB124-2]